MSSSKSDPSGLWTIEQQLTLLMISNDLTVQGLIASSKNFQKRTKAVHNFWCRGHS